MLVSVPTDLVHRCSLQLDNHLPLQYITGINSLWNRSQIADQGLRVFVRGVNV